MIPMALLMAAQFRAEPTDWLNRGAGEGRMQIASALGRIRPAGTFSFISGPVVYYTLALASLIALHFSRQRVPLVLAAAAWAALLLAGAVSGSRSFVVALAPVLAAAVVVFVLRPQLFGAAVRTAALAGFAV
jgi:hypothetical protein